MGNLRRPNASSATRTFNRFRSVVPMSGLCSNCLDGCKGACEVWLASFPRRDLMSLTEEAERISGIPYVMNAYREEAEKILAE